MPLRDATDDNRTPHTPRPGKADAERGAETPAASEAAELPADTAGHGAPERAAAPAISPLMPAPQMVDPPATVPGGPLPASSPMERPPAGEAPHDESARAVSALMLDLEAVADADGLAQEVAVLRASIRQLAQDGNMARHVKVLAELRHQIEALCTTLKTQQALQGHESDDRAAELARVLEELGDELGVPR